jgi:hypothetical protein
MTAVGLGIFVLLSGFTTPFTSMPSALQTILVINPRLYALGITKRVNLEGAGCAMLVPDVIPLIIGWPSRQCSFSICCCTWLRNASGWAIS